MLTATIEHEGKTRIERLFIIDCHSHLGQDVDGATMMNPLSPGGTFDFWGNVQGKIKAEWQKSGEQSFLTLINGKQAKISWSFTPYPFTDNLYSALEGIKGRHSELKDKAKFYTFIDQAVCFPFQDVFRDKQPEALYRASNINVSRFTTRFPFSMKLIGYARCDPMEGEKAVKEVRHSREMLGLRGLKLHPRSEGWVDNINDRMVVNVLVEAARHSMPVIFDTRGKGSIIAIGSLINSTRNLIKAKYPNLLPHFKVIIAHFAQGNVGDHEVYNTIVQPNTYGDLSMLHGEGAGNFLTDFRRWFTLNRKESVDNRIWSEYLLFGSDYPYFGDEHAQKLLIYLINKQFFDTGGTIEDARNILGLNQIRILPDYDMPEKKKESGTFPSTLVSNPSFQQNEIRSSYISILGLAKLIAENKMDIKKICFQFNTTWHDITSDLLITTIKNSNKQVIDLLFMNLVQDQSITLLTSLPPNTEWKKFGYKYFNPKDREIFAKIFKQCHVANDINKLSEVLQYFYS